MESWEIQQAWRDQAVRKAVNAADHILMDASDGSTEETNYLTARVAEEFMKKALIPMNSAILRYDMEKKEDYEEVLDSRQKELWK